MLALKVFSEVFVLLIFTRHCHSMAKTFSVYSGISCYLIDGVDEFSNYVGECRKGKE